MKSDVVMKPNWTVKTESFCNAESIKSIIVFNYYWNDITLHLAPYVETIKRNDDGNCIGIWHIKHKQLEN